MDEGQILQLVIIIIMILLSAFFSSAETAFTSITEVKIRSMLEEEKRGAATLKKVVENYGKMLSTILIGNNIVNISASALVTTFTIKLLNDNFVGYATGILTLCILLFGEIIPKNMAKIRGEQIAIIYAPIIYSLMILFTPVIWVVDHIARAILWLMHINPDEKNAITEAELRTYVDASFEDGVIESGEKTLINNVFDFSDSIAKAIMIPNVDMVCIEENASYEEVRETFKTHMYTRLPVYHEDSNHIIGILNIKDFILVDDMNHFSVTDMMRECYYTHEYKKTSDLLKEMRQKTVSMAFVLSEYGECVGMVTLEDLLEEIVGEIRDEFDEEEEDFIRELDEKTFVIEGSRKLDDINDAINTSLNSEAYDSIAGLVIETLDRLPEENDEVTLEDGTKLSVLGVDDNRITKVKLVKPEEVKEDKDSSSEEKEE